MIRVVVADDHQLFADGVSNALAALPDFEVVGTFGSGNDLVVFLRTRTADVAIVDWDMPGGGADLVGGLAGTMPAVVVTMHNDRATINEATEAGAYGFVSKAVPLTELAAVLRAASSGVPTIGLSTAELTVALEGHRSAALDPAAASLTGRELEVLELLASGVTATYELATALFISQKTVKNHLAAIFVKLAVSDRTQAAIEAIRLGLANRK